MFHTLFCPLDCYCVLTIACLLLLTFCTCLIVLCRTIGSIGISRLLCTPWSTSSFSSHWCPRLVSYTCNTSSFSSQWCPRHYIAFVLDSHPHALLTHTSDVSILSYPVAVHQVMGPGPSASPWEPLCCCGHKFLRVCARA